MHLLPSGFILCQELERELELQVGLKQEMEVAMKLLEKDTHEKQDTLAALRLQLDQVKTLNLQMFHKAQVRSPGWPAAFSRSRQRRRVNSTVASGLGTGGGEKTSKGRAAGKEDGGNGEGHGEDGAKVRRRSESMCNEDVVLTDPPPSSLLCALQTAEL